MKERLTEWNKERKQRKKFVLSGQLCGDSLLILIRFLCSYISHLFCSLNNSIIILTIIMKFLNKLYFSCSLCLLVCRMWKLIVPRTFFYVLNFIVYRNIAVQANKANSEHRTGFIRLRKEKKIEKYSKQLLNWLHLHRKWISKNSKTDAKILLGAFL